MPIWPIFGRPRKKLNAFLVHFVAQQFCIFACWFAKTPQKPWVPTHGFSGFFSENPKNGVFRDFRNPPNLGVQIPRRPHFYRFSGKNCIASRAKSEVFVHSAFFGEKRITINNHLWILLMECFSEVCIFGPIFFCKQLGP